MGDCSHYCNLDCSSIGFLGYSLAYGSQYTMDGATFVGRGDYFALGPSPSFWFFGTHPDCLFLQKERIFGSTHIFHHSYRVFLPNRIYILSNVRDNHCGNACRKVSNGSLPSVLHLLVGTHLPYCGASNMVQQWLFKCQQSRQSISGSRCH
jgi:hypothetical protein